MIGLLSKSHSSASDTAGAGATHVSFHCPHCDLKLRARALHAGELILCLSCSERVRVPAPSRGRGDFSVRADAPTKRVGGSSSRWATRTVFTLLAWTLGRLLVG